jgi:phosphatidyl-myo-inositol dimannoside synthase
MTEDERSRVLLVTRNMPPLWGGMEQLNWHLVDELKRKACISVVAPGGSRQSICDDVDVWEVALRPLPRFLLDALMKAVTVARRWRPDIVLAGSGLTTPIVWLAARISRARCVAYVHGLDVAVASVLYQKLWIPALRKMDIVIANSHATARLAEMAGVDPAKIKVVHPGVAMPDGHADKRMLEGLRAAHGWEGRQLLLSVGRLTNRKGLREFVAEVLPGIVLRHPAVLLLVVGGAPTQSLHAQTQTVESIQAAAEEAGVAANVQFLGVITDRDHLANIYQVADIHVFPVRDIPGDPEGFGMVAVEAAAHGLPTVAYATGGISDAVAEGVSGHLIPPCDGAAFTNAVLGLLDQPLPSDLIRSFANGFDWSHFGNDISEVLFGGSLR